MWNLVKIFSLKEKAYQILPAIAKSNIVSLTQQHHNFSEFWTSSFV